MTTEQQDKRRKAAAASKAIQALAQAVQAGRAGLPPSPKALAVLATVLRRLQDGDDPEKVLGYKRESAGKPPDKTVQEQAVRRMLELQNQQLDLSGAKIAKMVEAEFVAQQMLELRNQRPDLSDAEIGKLVEEKPRVSYATLYQNWFQGKATKNQKVDNRVERTYGEKVRKVTPLRAKLEREQWENAELTAEPPPMPDRPDASEDFKSM